MLLLIYLCIWFVRFILSETRAQQWLTFTLVSTLTASSAGLLLSQSVPSLCRFTWLFISWWRHLLFIMRLQLVHFCVLLWSLCIEILPLGMPANFLPNVAASINLLRLYSVTSPGLLLKILNNISPSTDPRVALLPLPSEHQAIDYCAMSLAGWQSSWFSTCVTVHLHSSQFFSFQVRVPGSW